MLITNTRALYMYESWAKCSLNHVYLKNIGMCAAQTGLSSQLKCVWSYRPIFLGLNSLNTTSKCSLWCCHYLHTLLVLLRRKQTLVWTDAILCTIEDHKLLTKIWIPASRHIINRDAEEGTGKSWMGKGDWVTYIYYCWGELWLFQTDKAVLKQCPVGFEFLTSCALQCWKNNGISWSRNKHLFKQIAILEPFHNSSMWNL